MPGKILLIRKESNADGCCKKDLEDYGYEVETLNTGEQAVERIKQTTDADLALLDMDACGEMEGMHTAERILDQGDIPVVFLLSRTGSDIVETTEAVTPYGYILKDSPGTVLDASIKAAFRLFDKLKKCEEKLTGQKELEEQLRFRNVILNTQQEVSLDGILIVDEEDTIVSFNQRFADIWGIPNEILASQSCEKALNYVIPKLVDPQEFADRIHYLYGHKQEKSFEEIALTDGRILERYSAPMFGQNDRYYGRVWYYRDITGRKQAEEAIKEQLYEKEIILKEVNHRVKNNFSSVESLLALHMQSTESDEAQSALQDAISRIQSMRVLYDKLLINDEHKEASVKDYIESLVDSIVGSFPDYEKVTVDCQITDFNYIPKRLFNLGIIINELITNSMKYAFEGRDSGLITVKLDKVDNHVTLIVQDDGNGLPEGFDDNDLQGFGLMIVRMLVKQLGGNLTIENQNGTRSTVEFDI